MPAIAVRLTKTQLDFLRRQKKRGIKQSKSFQIGLDILKDAIQCDHISSWKDEKNEQLKYAIDNGGFIHQIQVSIDPDLFNLVVGVSGKEKVSQATIARAGLELYRQFVGG